MQNAKDRKELLPYTKIKYGKGDLRMKTSKRKQELQKQRMIVLGIVFCIVVILIGVICLLTRKPNEEKTTQVQTGKEKENQVTNENSMQTSSNHVAEQDWKLMLANRENTIPEDYQIPLAKIEGQLYFDERALPYLNKLRNAVIEAGYSNLWIQSSYRSIELQKKLFSDKVDSYIKKGKGKQEAEKLAMQVVNKPGQSDHNLGLAVDFNYVNEDFKNLKVYQWLCDHAHEYGFILRYPEDKESITGVSYEPWHWRYVGKEHAKKIKEKQLCLEEYVKERNT